MMRNRPIKKHTKDHKNLISALDQFQYELREILQESLNKNRTKLIINSLTYQEIWHTLRSRPKENSDQIKILKLCIRLNNTATMLSDNKLHKKEIVNRDLQQIANEIDIYQAHELDKIRESSKLLKMQIEKYFENYSTIVRPISNQVKPREKINKRWGKGISELEKYANDRFHEGKVEKRILEGESAEKLNESYRYRIFGKGLGFSAGVKVNAADKILFLITNENPDAEFISRIDGKKTALKDLSFTPQELAALQDGNLQKKMQILATEQRLPEIYLKAVRTKNKKDEEIQNLLFMLRSK